MLPPSETVWLVTGLYLATAVGQPVVGRLVDRYGPRGPYLLGAANWGAFHGTDLDVQLRRRGVTQIVLGGIATSMGVESTARAAHEHGYHVTLATDAMADRSADMHQHSVENVFPRLGETGTTDEILALLATTPATT